MNYDLISEILNSIEEGTLYDAKYKADAKVIHLVLDENNEIKTDAGYVEEDIYVFDKLNEAKETS